MGAGITSVNKQGPQHNGGKAGKGGRQARACGRYKRCIVCIEGGEWHGRHKARMGIGNQGRLGRNHRQGKVVSKVRKKRGGKAKESQWGGRCGKNNQGTGRTQGSREGRGIHGWQDPNLCVEEKVRIQQQGGRRLKVEGQAW